MSGLTALDVTLWSAMSVHGRGLGGAYRMNFPMMRPIINAITTYTTGGRPAGGSDIDMCCVAAGVDDTVSDTASLRKRKSSF